MRKIISRISAIFLLVVSTLSFTTIAKSKVPTIALAHGFCIGGATSLVSACDIRLATKDAKFSIGETKLGLVADVGVIQRMPKTVSSGDMNELALTGRIFDGEHAERIRFVNKAYENSDELFEAGEKLANEISSNSKRIVQATKEALEKSSNLTVDQGLEYAKLWSTSFLISEDLREGVMAFLEKRDPKFNE